VADESVSWNPDDMKKLSSLFFGWARDIDKFVLKASSLGVLPGSVPNAPEFKQRVADRANSLKTSFTNLQNSFDEISKQITKVAQNYQTAEDINKDDAERLREMITNVSKSFPGISKVIPPPTTSIPNPPTANPPNPPTTK